MTTLRAVALTLALVFVALLSPALRASESPAGHWEGTIELPGSTGNLEVMVDLVQSGGAWSGTIDIPLQGAKGLPLDGVVVDGAKVRFTISNVPGYPTFDGTLEEGALRGSYTQSGVSMPFRLGREKLAKPKRPQEPQPPFPYASEEVTYKNGDVTLAGTLTLPPGDGPFPAVVLLTGSGAQDRDESAFDHKPFLVLADHLSRRGIAVLRSDDRGVGGSTGSVPRSTTADFAEDALAGVALLRRHPKIAKDRVGLLGHSEGGLAAPLAASKSSDVAFVVMLAGPAVPGSEVLLGQIEALSRAAGVPADQIAKGLETQRSLYAVLNSEADPAKRRARLLEVLKAGAAGQAKDELLAAQVEQIENPWFRHFLDFDPRPVLRQVKVPVLALNGELDLQVLAGQHLPEIEKALREAGNPDVTAKSLPGLNHLFQPAKTGLLDEYAASEVTMSPEVLALVSDWITARFGKPKG